MTTAPPTDSAVPPGRPGRRAAPPLEARDLAAWRLLEQFLAQVAAVRRDSGAAPHPSLAHQNRQLEESHYLGLFLFALLNPVIRTLRGLSRASLLPKVQQEICARPASLGSLSEMQHLTDPGLLEAIFTRLAAQLSGLPRGERPAHLPRWLVQDGSLIAALPRMAWALYGGGRPGFPNNAVRLHVSFDLESNAPCAVRTAPGRRCERAEWEAMIVPGAGYIGDRYYGESHQLLTRLQCAGVPFLVRLRDEVTVEEHTRHPLPAAAAAASVLSDAQVRLGTAHHQSTLLRLVSLRSAGGEILRLVTNLPPDELCAADAALLYKRRWEIEYFFKWMKVILREGRSHWLAESERGVQVQIYLTLIGALLLQLQLGERPGRRSLEALQLCLLGMATPEEAAVLVERERQSRAARGTKKSRWHLR